MPATDRPPLRATYRVQLHAGFTLDDAVAVVPYLAELGVSHLYCSPVLQAAPGSTHGYDVIDHGRVSGELGGEPAFDRLTDALRAHGMGLVLDVVPNHMSIAGEGNRWWWDVLEHGPASRYASWFDVDWDPPESRLHNVILLPVLPDHYGRVLESGELRVARDGGRLVVTHGERRFPLDPRTTGALITAAGEGAGSDELAFIGSALAELQPSTTGDPELVARRQRDAEVLGGRLAELASDPGVAAALDAQVEAVNRDPEALGALLDDQNYRLAFWRAASRDLAYRRFFDINELIGLRMERPEVFDATHELVLRWVAEGRVQGLRIDHPDGLRNPAAYFARLRAAAPEAWIVAEKILEADEELPADWPIDGTTGYRFANLATRMLVDGSAERPLTEAWAGVAAVAPEWDAIAAEARIEVLSTVLGSDVNRLADLFLAVCEENRRYRDFTRHELHQALREMAAAMPVYRTYVRPADGHVSDADRRVIADACRLAVERRSDLDPDLFEFLGRILRLEVSGRLAAELAMRFQQLTPAAMAKGVEDTAFYRHHRLVALNEVGGDPGRFGTDAQAVHRRLEEIATRWPREMLALSTHDTKRSADVRARLALLSQDPERWLTLAASLSAAAAPHRTGAGLPSAADEYLFLQTVVGAWPIDGDRAVEYMQKASREAKLRTSWTDPDPAYDEALESFARGALEDPLFTEELGASVDALRPAWHQAALSQLAVQLTAPGVPDIYQGTELWDLSLVDPDNRRPVDYDRRRRLLDEACRVTATEAWARADEGLAKLWLTRAALDVRRRHAPTFDGGAYHALPVAGEPAEAALAFLRGDDVITVVPQLVLELADGSHDTAIDLPDGRWRGLDGVEHTARVAVAQLWDAFPVAVLERVA